MTALYAIAEQYRAQLDALAELDLDAQTIADTVESIQGDLHDKLRAVIAFGLSKRGEQEMQAAAAKRMAERAASTGKLSEGLLAYALTHMQGTCTPEIATPEWSAKVAKTPAAVKIAEGAVIPPQYMRYPPLPEPVPDKKALGEALKAGAVLDGVTLQSGYRLSIK
jgi:hypothetical protein